MEDYLGKGFSGRQWHGLFSFPLSATFNESFFSTGCEKVSCLVCDWFWFRSPFPKAVKSLSSPDKHPPEDALARRSFRFGHQAEAVPDR